jgi:ribosomal protein S18 acetylase RimI-like enzyme
MDLLIRNLTSQDLEKHLDEFVGILSGEPHEYWTGEHFRTPLPLKFELSVAAFSGNMLAGYIIASLKEDGPYIHKYMVRKELRSMSTGKKMLDFFEKKILASGFNSIELSVMEENERAISFYRKNHFFETGRRKDSKDGTGLVILKKIIE